MERIPRAATAAAVLMIGLAFGATANTQPSRPAPPAGSLSPAPAATRPPAAPRLSVSAPAATPDRIVVRIVSPQLTGVRRVDLLVDGRAVARLRPRAGVFTGAKGWISTAGLSARRARVLVRIRGRGLALHRARSVTLAPRIEVESARRKRADTTAPAVAISSPAPGAVVSASVVVAAEANDASGVSRVDFAIDGALLSSDATSPYSASWNTTAVADGAHRITATAVDAAGNRGGASVDVSVRNAVIAAPPPASQRKLLWGAYIDGTRWGFGDAPWDARTIDRFEAQAGGKRVSILHWGQSWYANGVGQPFYPTDFEKVRSRGAIPMINWNSWDSANGGSADQPAFQLQDIVNGAHDAYIRSWATGAKTWGKPFFLRFNHEMNGTWYPWSESRNGNSAGQYVQAWRHVHDIFESVGATNATWVWSPNAVYTGSIPLPGLYPGDADVDWVAMDGYNWGTNPAKPNGWKTFSQVFSTTYDQLGVIAPAKPVMIAEMASSEYGGSKAAWITDALAVQLATSFPRIRALVWFDWNADGLDWVLESSTGAQSAFAAGIASTMYAGNAYGGLSASPIPAP